MTSFWWRHQITSPNTSSKWRHKNFIFKPPLFSKILVAPLNQTSDVARPLSYKTKTTYFFKTRPRPPFQDLDRFFKDHQIINPRPLAQPEILIERGLNWKKNLWRYFGDVMVMTSLKWRHKYILKFDFVIIIFKNHHLAKSRNFRSPNLKHKQEVWKTYLVLLVTVCKAADSWWEVIPVPSNWKNVKVCKSAKLLQNNSNSSTKLMPFPF